MATSCEWKEPIVVSNPAKCEDQGTTTRQDSFDTCKLVCGAILYAISVTIIVGAVTHDSALEARVREE